MVSLVSLVTLVLLASQSLHYSLAGFAGFADLAGFDKFALWSRWFRWLRQIYFMGSLVSLVSPKLHLVALASLKLLCCCCRYQCGRCRWIAEVVVLLSLVLMWSLGLYRCNRWNRSRYRRCCHWTSFAAGYRCRYAGIAGVADISEVKSLLLLLSPAIADWYP